MQSEREIKETLTEHRVILEMIETERNFNATLAFLSNILSNDELVNNINVLIQFRLIVDQLKLISDKLLANVLEAISIRDDQSTRNILKEQRTQLLKAFFKIYPMCTNLYTEYVQYAGANPALFQAIDKYTYSQNPLRLNLQAFLIQPVQRGPRYAMLISAAISYNAKLEHGDEAKLTDEKLLDLTKLSDLVQTLLLDANAKTSQLDVRPFQLSDIPGMIINYFQAPTATPSAIPAQSSKDQASAEPVAEGYRFGDLSRGLYRMWQTRASQPSSLPPVVENPESETEIRGENDPGNSNSESPSRV